jgi:YVTN family beta-propeller protein
MKRRCYLIWGAISLSLSFLIITSLPSPLEATGESISTSGQPHIETIIAKRGQNINDFIHNYSPRFSRFDVDPGLPAEGDYMGGIAFTNDGNRVLLTNRMTDNITVFDWSTMNMITNIDVGDYPARVAVTDDYAVVSCVFSDEVYVINLTTYAIEEIFSLPSGQQPWIIRISPDGNTAYVSCDISNTCEVFDLQTMTHTMTINNFPVFLYSYSWISENGRNKATFSNFEVTPDGNYLIVGNWDNSVFFFNTSSGLATDTIDGIQDCHSIALSGDGNYAVAANFTNPAVLHQIDISSKTVTDTVIITGYTISMAHDVGVNDDGSKAYIGISDNKSAIARFPTSDFVIFSSTYTAFWIGTSPDHGLAISAQYRFSIVDFATETVLGQSIGYSQYAGAVSPVGSRAVGFDWGRHEGIYFFDYSTPSSPTYRGTAISGEEPEGDGSRRVAITPDGSKAVVANVLSDNISIIDLLSHSVDTIIPNCGDRVQNVAITSDSRWVVACGMNSNSVKIIDLTTNSLVADVPTGSRPGVVSIGPGDTLAYVGNISSNTVSVVRLAGASSYEITDISCGVIGVVWACYGVCSDVEASPDGDHVLVAASFDDQVIVIDVNTNSIVATLTVGDFPIQIAFNNTGEYATVTNYSSDDFSIIHVNGASSSVVGTFSYGDDGPLRLTYNPVLDEMAIGHYYNKAVVNVNPETGAFISRQNFDSYGSLIQVRFDENGDPIVLTMSDGTDPGHIHIATDAIPLPASPSFFDYNGTVHKAVVSMPGPDFASIIEEEMGIEEIEVSVSSLRNGIKISFNLRGSNHKPIKWLIERASENEKKNKIAECSGEKNEYLDSEVDEGKTYKYWLTALLDNGSKKKAGPYSVNYPLFTSGNISIYGFYPIPVKNKFYLEVSSLQETKGEIDIYDISGKSISYLWKGTIERGLNKFNFDIQKMRLSSGIYFIKIKTNNYRLIRKITVLK